MRLLNLEKEVDEPILSKYAPKLRNDYIEKRNLIDFEMVYNFELINKYAEIFFKEKNPRKQNLKAKKHEKIVFDEVKRIKATPEFKKITNNALAKKIVVFMRERHKNHKPYKESTYEVWIKKWYPKRGGRPRGSSSKA